MNVTITPKKLNGEIIIPPSKSITHRAIIAASLASGECNVFNVAYSEDIKATIKAMESLGASIECFDNYVHIKGSKVKRVNQVINANESGSTLRFLIPIALVNDSYIEFTGNNNLVNRPLDSYLDIFTKQGIKYERQEHYLPLKIYKGLKSGEFSLKGNVSSQFITGLLFALPLLDGDSKIIITTPLESKGYIDLTIDVLKHFKIDIINNNYQEFIIKGNQSYVPTDYKVEEDYSQAAFFLVANALGNNINIKSLNPLSLQGDKKIIDDLKAFNADISFTNDKVNVRCNQLLANNLEFDQSPDLFPIEVIMAVIAKGKSIYSKAGRLKIKESNRIKSMVDNLALLGVNTIETDDGVIIEGPYKINGGIIDSYNDHRIAMSFAILSTCMNEKITIKNAECVKKSFPTFWDEFKRLNGNITITEED